MIFAVFIIIAVTLYYHNISFYCFIWSNFSGGNGIRAVTRIVVVLLYPAAFVLAITLTLTPEKIAEKFNHLTAVIVGCILIGLLVIDQPARVRSVSIQSYQKRITDLRAKIKQAGEKVLAANVLWVRLSNEPNGLSHLDAMLAGQELGLRVFKQRS